MAEVTAMRNNALPYPVYGLPWAVVFPLLDADGDPVSPSSPDSEVSKNGDTFADCTNEAVEIATSSGSCYLLLTAAEMTADIVTVQIKSTGAKTTVLTLYPRKLVTLRTGTCQGGAAGYMTLDANAGALNDIWNGCIVAGVLDSATEVRVITDYDGSNQQASVTPNWNTTPDSDDTFTIYLPEGRQLPSVNVEAWKAATAPAMTGDSFARLGAPAGASVSADVASIKTDTGTTIPGRLPAALVSGRMDSHVGSIADAVLTAAKFASGAFDAVWSVATRLLTAGTNIVLAKGTGVTGFNDLSAAQVNAEADAALADVGVTTTVTGRIDAAISSRLASGSYTAPDNAGIAAIQAKTDNLPSDPADQSLIIAATNAIVADTEDIQSRLPAALTGAGNLKADAQVVSDKTGYSLSSAGIQAIWDALTSALTTAGSIGKRLVDNIDAAISSRLASAGYTAPDNASITLIKNKTDNLPASPAAVGSAMTLTSGERDAVADALLDRANGVETGITPREAMRLGVAADSGKTDGLGTTTVHLRNAADTKNRVTATVDEAGNRTAVTRDLT